jgi:hypothetical protein
VGRDWPPGWHTEAQNAYNSLDTLVLPPEEKIARLRRWLEQRAPASVVEEEFARMALVARRFWSARRSALARAAPDG